MAVQASQCVFDPVATPSTSDETAARIGLAIRLGILAPGTRLPPERDLADRLRISRSTLRQALAVLTSSGHLIARRGRSGGTFVAEAPPITSNRPFPPERRQSLLDWRMTLELGAVELAAERASVDACRRLDEAVRAFENGAVGTDWAAFRRADAIFHLRVAEAVGIPRLFEAMTHVQGDLSDLLDGLAPAPELDTVIEEHREVVAAVARGDAGGAREAMRRHLIGTERAIGERTGRFSTSLA